MNEAVDRILDRFVYGPYGAMMALRQDLEGSAQAGRERIAQQVANARFIGEMAVTHGGRELRRRVSDLLGETSASKTAATARCAPEPGAEDIALAEAEPEVVEAAVEPPQPIDHLLAGYDSLSASQVVRLLDSLDAAELALVAAYEAATRGRRTIINRTSQLIDEA